MLVSVVIPAFGRRTSLEFAVKSAAAQEGFRDGDIEIVIVDDASPVPITAPSGIEGVRVVRLSENLGAAGARNAGVEASRGDFIAFLDSDDVWQPQKLLNQWELASKLGKEQDRAKFVLSCGFYIPNRMSNQLELRIPTAASQLREFLGGCWMCPGSTLFLHRSAFESTGMFDERLRRLEDYEWLLRFAATGGRLFVSDYAGAIIAPSSGPVLEPIRDAIQLIRNTVKLNKMKFSPTEQRSFESYLELEMTAAYLSKRQRWQAAYHLLKSLFWKPRLQLSTSDFWQRSNRIPNDVVSTYRQLVACSE